MENDITFGEWLRRRRRGLDLTQQELAQRVGCTVSTLRKIEAGERRPSKELPTGRDMIVEAFFPPGIILNTLPNV